MNGSLQAQAPSVPTEQAAATVLAALRHYACSCWPGQCAMSDSDDAQPVDDTLCGRRAAEAIGAVAVWQPMDTAPKDRPILGWCEAECGKDNCAFGGGEGPNLCLYHGHAEGLSFASTGPHILEWGGSWDDRTHEYDGGHMPDWWFVVGSEFEQAANPTYWMPLPAAPDAARDASQVGMGPQSGGMRQEEAS